jgi:hypothetical protein
MPIGQWAVRNAQLEIGVEECPAAVLPVLAR